jgi:hypothetical protein
MPERAFGVVGTPEAAVRTKGECVGPVGFRAPGTQK